MRLWLGTWNVEQSFPSNEQIQALLNHSSSGAFAYNTCDIIAMGFQEARRDPMPPNISGYQCVSNVSVNGQTKNTENCQCLFVYKRRNNPYIWHIGSDAKVVERSTMKKIKFWSEYGKGSAVDVVADVRNERDPTFIGIATAHLDSKSDTKRTQQVTNLFSAAKIAANRHVLDILFLMGDLNYRLKKLGVLANISGDDFSNMIVNHREQLFVLDSLKQSDILGDSSGWCFPEPFDGTPAGGRLQLPTYKRKYKGQEGITAKARATNLNFNPNVVRDCFDFKISKTTGLVKEGKRAGKLDFGWLDRIGFLALGGKRPVLRYSGSAHELVLSDHSPTYSVFDIA